MFISSSELFLILFLISAKSESQTETWDETIAQMGTSIVITLLQSRLSLCIVSKGAGFIMSFNDLMCSYWEGRSVAYGCLNRNGQASVDRWVRQHKAPCIHPLALLKQWGINANSVHCGDFNLCCSPFRLCSPDLQWLNVFFITFIT